MQHPLKVLWVQETLESRQKKEKHLAGIAKAKKDAKYSGCKKLSVDTNLLKQITEDFENQKITEAEALQRLGGLSRSTFYRRLKELRKAENDFSNKFHP